MVDLWGGGTVAMLSAQQFGDDVMARRAMLLRAYRGRLTWDDLGEAHDQAVLEVLPRVHRGALRSLEHARHAVEQKFASRITDRQRQIGGRSKMARELAFNPGLEGGAQHRACWRPGPHEATVMKQELTATTTLDERHREGLHERGVEAECLRKGRQRARAKLRLAVAA